MAFDKDGNDHRVSNIKLLYDGQKSNAYRMVLHDAENILTTYESKQELFLYKTNASAVRIYLAPEIQLTEEERKQAVVFRNGMPYLLIGKGKNLLKHVAPDQEWVLPQSQDGVSAELIQETIDGTDGGQTK